ncbi:MAG: hypothetical protein ACKVH8_25220 [Pirellulales bacterium]|jgi:hypothetical protein
MIAFDRFPASCFDIYRKGEVIRTAYIWQAKRASEIYNKLYGKKTGTVAIPIVKGLPMIPKDLEDREAYDAFRFDTAEHHYPKQE